MISVLDIIENPLVLKPGKDVAWIVEDYGV
jgi:hypothetical protein